MSMLTFHPTSIKADATHSFFAYDPYISKFWLPKLGPTATWLIEELCLNSLIATDTFKIDTATLSVRLGTGIREGRSCPVNKQLSRLVNAGIIYQLSADEYMVPKTINTLGFHLIRNLEPELQIEHLQWIAKLETCPLTTQRRRMSSLICRLAAIGIPTSRTFEIVENSGLHPSVIGEMVLEVSRHNFAA